MAEKRKRRIIWADEVTFTAACLPKAEWSPQTKNVNSSDAKLKMKTVRAIVGISREKGVEAVHFTAEPFNSESFCAFLDKIKTYSGRMPVLFMDNVGYHRTKKVQKHMKLLKIEPIFNMKYRPDRNAVELTFN